MREVLLVLLAEVMVGTTPVPGAAATPEAPPRTVTQDYVGPSAPGMKPGPLTTTGTVTVNFSETKRGAWEGKE